MNIDQYDYMLPKHLIAQEPLLERSASRLLSLHKHTGQMRHHSFLDIIHLLESNDLLILNDTRVIPARLFGIKEGTGAKVEVLLLADKGDNCWEALVKPGKRLKTGSKIDFAFDVHAVVLEERSSGERLLRFACKGNFQKWLHRSGQMPLPPYIKQKLDDPERYQTIYARCEGSAAAPTAGLHFTQPLFDQLKQKGVQIAYITLHVGLDTFRPLSVDRIEDHVMHREYYHLSQQTANLITDTKKRGGRVIAVGTTSCRALEAAGALHQINSLQASHGWTDIFIYPGHTFRVVDALITNFHLPKSTLLMLVSALAGRDRVFRAYERAVEQQYRFFSFGDAMFIY